MSKPNDRGNRSMYCVIVGDIINSREIDIDTRERVYVSVKAIFDRINTEYLSSLIAPFGIVRGDAFEGVLLTQYIVPKIIEEIIKAFYRVENTLVRISAVTDQLTTIAYDRNENDGPAFYNALANLENMKKCKSNHWLQISINTNSIAQPIIDSQLKLLTSLTEGWTDKQRKVVWEMDECSVEQKKQNIVAKKLGIPTSVVNKQLKAANYEAYRFAWDSLENYLIALDEDIVVDKPQHIKNYVAYYNVALRRYKQYNYNEAVLLLENSLELAKDLGEDDLQLVPIYNLLAETYVLLLNYKKAKEIICESLRLQDKLPKAKIQYVKALHIKSKIYFYENEYDMANKYINEALNIARNFLDEKHPFVKFLKNEFVLIENKMQ